MTEIFWFCLGIIIGLFIPGPYNETIKKGLISIWKKIFQQQVR